MKTRSQLSDLPATRPGQALIDVLIFLSRLAALRPAAPPPQPGNGLRPEWGEGWARMLALLAYRLRTSSTCALAPLLVAAGGALLPGPAADPRTPPEALVEWPPRTAELAAAVARGNERLEQARQAEAAGNLIGARQMAHEAFVELGRALGEHPELEPVLETLVRLHLQLEDLVRAELAAGLGVTIWEQQGWPGRRQLWSWRGRLAAVWARQGRLDLAEAALREVLAAQELLHGADSPVVGATLEDLRYVLEPRGGGAEAPCPCPEEPRPFRPTTV